MCSETPKPSKPMNNELLTFGVSTASFDLAVWIGECAMSVGSRIDERRSDYAQRLASDPEGPSQEIGGSTHTIDDVEFGCLVLVVVLILLGMVVFLW